MKILHLSFECYPIAKVGGLADVVGALPKYQSKLGTTSSVIMPYYDNAFTKKNKLNEIYKEEVSLDTNIYQYTIYKVDSKKIGFDLFFVHIEGLLDRENVYGYEDDLYRFLSFQLATLNWIKTDAVDFDILHCHDHHTSMVPFFINYCYDYKQLEDTPTILTIHNAQYQGQFSHDLMDLLPSFDFSNVGLLDWYGQINPLATGIKCASRVNTVSPSYMDELKHNANGLEGLLRSEENKCIGILNGIDDVFWNPEKDKMLVKTYKVTNVVSGKKKNKIELCKKYGLDPELPLFGFIGRLVGEKSADLLPEAFKQSIKENQNINIFLLGSGHQHVEEELLGLKEELNGNFNVHIGYDEKLSHEVYAASDFLLMPSRVEPCGLNQMYSLRYGTIPIVRRTGGLKDTVIDIGDDGFGICHDQASVWDICYSINRAIQLYNETNTFRKIQKRIMKIDNSWTKSAQDYLNLYSSINLPQIHND
ncbi:glycogen synthase [Tenacibaculum sp. M341]|uniref:glycogen synthase n=1 Tax=Tenacibaculum sp. M341 TaxID=2530339 RepID=UPI001052EC15|nr:glycogen/starch synthase [Tenacibaculum sp. M341]TCI91704.1 glycogen synthase [Tenacibaculum sp. M341]